MSTELNFRIHPTTGIARVGNSEKNDLAPETVAGHSLSDIDGGLPIKKITEAATITSIDIRENTKEQKFKRQTAGFKIYKNASIISEETYSLGPYTTMQKIQIGAAVNGN